MRKDGSNQFFGAVTRVAACVVGCGSVGTRALLWAAISFLVAGCAGQGVGAVVVDGAGVQDGGWIREGWALADLSSGEYGTGTGVERGEGVAAVVSERTVSIPTYPYDAYQIPAFDTRYSWPYQQFDRERFLVDEPQPEDRTYRLIGLENEYLEVLILPELGGRIWQVTHKASGNQIFYQNEVVKPSPWGPPQQLGWFALGGLEWNVPVDEHGYDWGTTWDVQTFSEDSGAVGVELGTPDDGRLLDVAITVSLAPNVARVDIGHRIINRSDEALGFEYWQTAMLAPGPGNSVGGTLEFILPNDIMALHSSGDPLLPGPQQRFTWPIYLGRDMSRLDQWQEYLGFFEYPAARGPFVGVYDTAVDAGAVRVFPPDVARGSKVFALGWHNALPSDFFTDDGSAYVELHGGLSPSFFEQATLAGGNELAWQESWYPVQGIGGLAYANERAAISVVETDSGWQIGIYAVERMSGEIILSIQDTEILRRGIRVGPGFPHREYVPGARVSGTSDMGRDDWPLTITLVDEIDQVVLSYTLESSAQWNDGDE